MDLLFNVSFIKKLKKIGQMSDLQTQNKINAETIKTIVAYCNENIVPDNEYLKGAYKTHRIEWFKKYFDFIANKNLKLHLADAYYQARFLYKLMSGLRLTAFKQTAITKFQIQQYASIYEAIIDYSLETYHKRVIQELLKETEYRPVPAFASTTKLIFDNEQIFACRQTSRAVPLKKVKIDKRTKIAVDLGIINEAIKKSIDELYDLRNNVHLLKAASTDYKPTIKQAMQAFKIMNLFTDSVKKHLKKIKNNDTSRQP